METNLQFIIALTLSFIVACFGYYLADRRGRNPIAWFIIGLLFGVFGILVLYFLPSLSEKKKEEVVRVEEEFAPVVIDYEPFYKEWFYLDEAHQQQGPVGFDYLKSKWMENVIHPSTYVWSEGMAEWRRINELPDFMNAISEPRG